MYQGANNNMHLLGKILSSSLTSTCNHLHRDQVGFILGRQAGDNVIRVVLHIHQVKSMSWLSFLKITLKYILCRWGFGDSILAWVPKLYSNPLAVVDLTRYYSQLGQCTKTASKTAAILHSLFPSQLQKDPAWMDAVKETDWKIAAVLEDALVNCPNQKEIQDLPA